MRAKTVVWVLGISAALGCGVRGPPRPATAPPVTSSPFQAQNPGREFPSREPLEESGVPPSLRDPPPPEPLPDGGLSPFKP